MEATRFPTQADHWTIANDQSHCGGWSAPSTPLIGRDALLTELVRRVLDPECRLLTLTGPGGVGKTRLAIALLDRLAGEFPGPRRFVPLAGVPHPSLVPEAIAWSLTGRESGSWSPRVAAAGALGPGRALLVLDNFERVTEAAPFVIELLSTLPNALVVVTSRETLRVRAEQSIAVPPLALSTSTNEEFVEQGDSDAVILFLDRVRAIRPDFEPSSGDMAAIVEICRRLDGLPLAIELAAARCRALTPEALLARMTDRLQVLSRGPRDLPERQRTMRDTIAWSYDLLAEDDRVLFRRLSVFEGTFSLSAAETVVGQADGRTGGLELPALRPSACPSVLDGIASLLDKNLLREIGGVSGDQRFGMLQTIREFASHELVESGEATAVRRAHANWCLHRSQQCWSVLYRDAFETDWFGPLEEEHDDVRAALAWLEANGDATTKLQAAANFAPFWFFHSHRREGVDWLERGIAAFGDRLIPDALHAQALHCIGLLLNGKPAAIEPLLESIEIWTRLNDEWGIGASSIPLALNLNALGRYNEAMTYAQAAMDCYRETDRVWYGSAVLELGLAFFGAGDRGAAKAPIVEAMQIALDAGDWYGAGLAMNALAQFQVDDVDLAGARATLIESLHMWRRLVMLEGLADAFAVAAYLAISSGDAQSAAGLTGAVDAIAPQIDYVFTRIHSNCIDVARTRSAEILGAAFEQEHASGLKLSRDQAWSLAMRVATDTTAVAPVVDEGRPSGLTSREIDVLLLVAEGKTDREIGEILFISRATAARHVANIFLKLDVNSRTAAAAYAFRSGLVIR